MLNEDRIILMTKLASYEQKEGKKNIAVTSLFRSDFISVQVLKAALCATFAYLVGLAVYVLYDFERFLQDIYKIDLMSVVKNILIYYGITVVAYCLIVYIISTIRYAKAQKNLRIYYQNLRKLNSMYQDQ